MSKPKTGSKGADMLPEYDFSKAVRGKYHDRFRRSSNVVVLDSDVAKVFPNATAVNDALRVLAAAARRTQPTRKRRGPGKRSGNRMKLTKPAKR